MEDRPRAVNTIIFLWFIMCILFLLRCWHYYAKLMIQSQSIFEFYQDVLYFITNNGSLLIAVVLIFAILNEKTWAGIVSTLFSFGFLLSHGPLFFYSLLAIIFLDDFISLFKQPHFVAVTIANLLMPFILIIIFILLFRPKVKEYFNRT